MDGVILNLLATLLLSVALSSSAQQQNLLPGNVTEVIQSSVVAKIASKTSSTPKLIPHKITDKSYEKKNQNTFSQLNKKMKKWLKTKKETTFDVENMVIISDPPTPAIDQTFPAKGSIPDDGCDSSSVRFDDGKCYPLMGRKPCGDPQQWVTVDPKTFKGRCVPRICGRDRVFVVRTGLCHDIFDKSECQGGRRLYYSPYGDPVCDCPVGEYPFPYPKSDCVALFTQGPCPYGQVVAISSDNSLRCKASKCPPTYDSYYNSNSKPKQMVPTSDGKCYELGTAGPCSSYDDTSSLLGLDMLKNELECVDVTDPWSPYFFSQEENDLLDSVFDQFYPEYDFFRIYLVYQGLQHENELKYGKKKKGSKQHPRRQGGTSISVPSNPPIRPGNGQGKGNSKLVPQQPNRGTNQAVKPAKPTGCTGGQTFNPSTGSCAGRG
ncbi:uncharacterized protein LOC124209730 [Daphnia pulex]|uniref:uncharacterized protein LOC124209730 n=1 Tax=Daphnia pulex TaxID=6669 RepID=UPI001EDEFF29|nr:uncharacterized protein LOC124209730 [Daphnia pulex]